MKLNSKLCSFLIPCGSLLVASSLQAASLFWDATPGTPDGASDGGAGTWNTATANWDNGASYELWNNGGNDTAVFGGTAGAVTLGSNVTIGGLTFNTNNYSIAPGAVLDGGPYTITFGTAGDINVSTGTSTIGAEIAGSSTITKTGNGVLQLNAVNSFTGDTVISAGTLRLGTNNNTGTLGPATYDGNITIATGALLDMTNNNNQTFNGVISGGGNLQKRGGGTLTLAGANTYTGKTIIGGEGAGGRTVEVSSFNSVNSDGINPGIPSMTSSSLGAPTTIADGTIQLGSGSNVRSSTLIYTGSGETTDRVMNVQFNSGAKHTITSNATGGGLLNFTSNFTINPSSGNTGGGLTLRGSGDGQIAQMGTIPGILEKADAGTWTIGGTNSANSVKVSGGTLIVDGSLATAATGATPAGSVSIASAATLTVNGSISAPATTISNASAVLDGTGSLIFKIDDTTSDLVSMTNGTLTATGLTVAVNETGAGLTQAEYVLVNVTGGLLDGTFAGLTGADGYELNYDTPGQVKLVQPGGGSSYDTWAAINAPTGTPADDYDGDGVSNAIEFVLGGDKDTNDLDKLPAVATTGTDMTFTFIRDRDSIDASVDVEIEVSTNLENWTETYPVGAVSTADVTVTDNLDGTDTITLTVARAPDDKKFARIKVTITP